ncbi:hypothetical protein KP509_02G030400 [Ceratopteris richardii]|uniref:Secreted protein n=1 Tax=Ceratopteris richardii TaxID=49495 RepID=A0A8T2V8E0_CERRI|nr:hypothetical protein KP509_02G030400 [Ceratopteris richardii]
MPKLIFRVFLIGLLKKEIKAFFVHSAVCTRHTVAVAAIGSRFNGSSKSSSTFTSDSKNHICMLVSYMYLYWKMSLYGFAHEFFLPLY